MAGKKKVAKKTTEKAVAHWYTKDYPTPKKKKGRPKGSKNAAKPGVAKLTAPLEVRHVYCVMPRYATSTLCEFTTLKAAQEMIEANSQINNIELCVVVTRGGHFRSDEW